MNHMRLDPRSQRASQNPIICDIESARLERALGFGADRVINSRETNLETAVKREYGLGPSVVIDGAGVPSLLDLACRIACPAGRIGLLGFSSEPSELVQQQVVGKELTLVGSRLNRRLLPEVIGWLESGKLKPDPMITQTFVAADVREAFDFVERHPEQVIKAQLAFDA
jgi:L-gulonate 5-dehydrogenase